MKVIIRNQVHWPVAGAPGLKILFQLVTFVAETPRLQEAVFKDQTTDNNLHTYFTHALSMKHCSIRVICFHFIEAAQSLISVSGPFLRARLVSYNHFYSAKVYVCVCVCCVCVCACVCVYAPQAINN